MKICSLCGSTYGDRVDFCFKDGTPLLPVASGEAVAEPAAPAGSDPTDAPHPSNLAGEDMPEPNFLGFQGAGETVDKASRWSRPFAAPDPNDEEITASISREALAAALKAESLAPTPPTGLPISAGVDEVDRGLSDARTLVPDRFPEMMELTSPRVRPPPPRRDLAATPATTPATALPAVDDAPADDTLPRPIPMEQRPVAAAPTEDLDYTLPRAIPMEMRARKPEVTEVPEPVVAPVTEVVPEPVEPPQPLDALSASRTLVAEPEELRAALAREDEASDGPPVPEEEPVIDSFSDIVSAPISGHATDIIGAPLLGSNEDAGGLFSDDDDESFAGFGAPPDADDYYEPPPPSRSKLPLLLLGLSVLVVGVGAAIFLSGDKQDGDVAAAEQPAEVAAPEVADAEADAAAARAAEAEEKARAEARARADEEARADDEARADEEARAEREAEQDDAEARALADAEARAEREAEETARAEREAEERARANREAEERARAAREAEEPAVAVADVEPAEGKVTISSNPPGATVLVDGAPAGKTPMTVTLPFGAHNLSLTLDGYVESARAVDVNNATMNFNYSLEEVPPPVEPEVEEPEEQPAEEPAAPTSGMVNLFGVTGSKVTIDGAVAGIIPASVFLANGVHSFQVQMPNGTVFTVQHDIQHTGGGGPLTVPLTPQ